VQQVHTPFGPTAEVILVLQLHNERGEQVLERAPAISPQDRHLGEDEGGNGDNDNNAQQLLLYIKSHLCSFFALSPHAAEAARQDTNPLNINLIFMDVMC
jgi:hypothetical protein